MYSVDNGQTRNIHIHGQCQQCEQFQMELKNLCSLIREHKDSNQISVFVGVLNIITSTS